MADTALKFGPEWLRALTEPQAGMACSGGGPPLNNIKRPEFRYGREEMLDIYHREIKPPEDLSAFGSLYVEACQLPLNLMQMSEEEIRAWQRGANSDAGQRPYGPPGGKRPPSPVGRGRGRGRGSATTSAHPHYDRNRSADDDFDGARGYGGMHAPRGRSSGIYERQTSERGGWFDQGPERSNRGAEDEMNGGGGSASPRKGYTRAPFDDWRGMKAGGEGAEYKGGEDGWRTSGGAARTKWGGSGPVSGAPSTWRSSERDSGSGYGRGGKFGDMGRGGTSERWRRDDDKAPQSVLINRPGGGSLAGRRMRGDHLPEWANEEAAGGSFDESGKFRAEQHRLNGVRNARDEWEEQERWEDEEVDPDDILNTDDIKNGKSLTREQGHSKAGSEETKANDSSTAKPSNSVEGGVGGSTHNENRAATSATAVTLPAVVAQPLPSANSGGAADSILIQQQAHSEEDRLPRHDHMETMAGNLVSSLVDEDEPAVNQQASGGRHERTGGGGLEAGAGFATAFGVLAPPAPPPHQPALVEPSWTYLDPQGQTQGPFQSDEMLEWFTAGYFPVDLMVKRSEDTSFLSLNDVTKRYGRCPFTPGLQPPPFSDLEERLKQEQMLRIHQQYLLQQQLFAQQQQQQLMALQQQQRPDLNKLLSLRLGGLGPQSDLIGGYGGTVDPLRSLLGSLGVTAEQHQPVDPLKQFMARGAAIQPGLDLLNGQQPRLNQQPVSSSPTFDQGGGLFGNAPPHEYHHGAMHQQSNQPTPEPTVASSTTPATDFDPIKSLLQQLESSRTGSSSSSPQLGQRSTTTTISSSQKIHTVPEQQLGGGGTVATPIAAADPHHEYFSEYSKSNQYEKPVTSVTSIWDRPAAAASSSVWNSERSPEPTEPATASSTPAAESSEDRTPSPDAADDPKLAPSVAVPEEEVAATFVTPKVIEKKEKKSKKAEEKRRAKEAKKQSELASSLPYIPGMPGSVQPEEQVVVTQNVLDQREEEKWRAQQEELAQQRAQMEALARLQEEQRARLRREEAERIRDEKLAKLAPWAKTKETSPTGGQEQKRSLTLHEIQRMEAEKERVEREARELAEAQAREEARRREEEERVRRAAKQANWALAVAPSVVSGPAKSLAEIQAEEARVEKEKQERERSQRLKEAGLAAAAAAHGGWKTGGGTSWAGKIAANAGTNSPAVNRVNPPGGGGNSPWNSVNGSSAVNIVAPEGFWEPVIPPSNQKKQQQQQNNNAHNNNNNNNNANNNKKKAKKEGKQGDKGNNSRAERNEFEDWCTSALEGLQAQVDIPTFLTFLRDIESPYEVHDYVKSYVGDGKAQKKFAMEYLERRSRWKNALKSGGKYEDDLTTPALALSPGDGEFQEAGKKGKKKTKASRSNLNHLLGFSVQGQGVNRGELDVPQ